jgi:outer membrane protein TolC
MLKVTFFIIFLFTGFLHGENQIIQNYIDIALQNNLALKQREFALEKSLAALKEARGLFLPSITINARYSWAGGGRLIDIPVGDLVNPIYQALNQILQQPVFPENLPNQSFLFFREKEHETKISVFQPLFQPEIYYNYKINSNFSQIEKTKRDIFSRRLISDVKTAYFNYLKTINILEIIERTEELLTENLRVSQILFRNQKATKDVVFRAKSDLSSLEQEKANAQKNIIMAKSYFNFLLNRPLDEDIETIQLEDIPIQPQLNIQQAEKIALSNREELKQLEFAVEAAQNAVNISKSAFLPDVFAAIDYGFQGEEYRFNEEDDFWMASAVLRWNLFNGFQDRAKIQQTTLVKRKLETQNSEIVQQIQLEVREAYQNLIVSRKSIKSAEDRLSSAKKTFEIVDKKYQLGLIPQIEYLDNRNNLIEAEVNQVIIRFDLYIRQAEYERVLAQIKL